MTAVVHANRKPLFDDRAFEEVEAFAKEIMLALGDGEVMEWKVMFACVRRLRALEGADEQDVCTLRPVVDYFCQILLDEGWGAHVAFEDFEGRWIDFALYWKTVVYPEGQGPLEIAFQHASAAPLAVRSPYSDDYVLLVSTAYYLQLILDEEDIFLPVERVGQLFSRPKMYGSRLVNLAIKDGLLRVVAPHRVRRLARTYRFVLESDAYTPPTRPRDVSELREIRRRLIAS